MIIKNIKNVFLLSCVYLCIPETCNGFSAMGKIGSKDVKPEVLKKCDPCPKGIRCVPPVQCPAVVRAPKHERPQLCDLPAGTHGYCCTTGYNHTTTSHKHLHTTKTKARSQEVSYRNQHEADSLRSAVEKAKAEISHELHKEKIQNVEVSSHHPSYFHNLLFRSSSDAKLDVMSHHAIEQVYASQIYKQRQHIPSEDFALKMVDEDLVGTSLENNCAQAAPCPPQSSKYRSVTGHCNNPQPGKSSYGAAGSPMERLLPPSYEDGIWEARVHGHDRSPLTNPRTISRTLFHDADRPHHSLNLLFMQFGQFITHDVTQSASIKQGDGKSVQCCTADGSSVLPPQNLHYSCMPIEIEGHDEFFSQFNQRCMNFVRSALSMDEDCKLGYGKQISKVTHFIDASTIYGSDLKTQSELRSFRQGMLRMTDDYGRTLLPLTEKKDSCGAQKGPCFFAGDARSNQIITLTALHLLFAREHNQIAGALSELNRHWSDEQLFYETRRIIIGKLQHIIYSEWLPYLIGNVAMDRFGLRVTEHGYSDDYDPDVNACITSEFTTAAMRFGHSIVDGKFIVHNGPKVEEIIDIPDVMFNSARLRRVNYYDGILKVMTDQPMQQVDAAVTHGLSRFLFRGHNPFGLDLAAINIHRGRDHGIRCYNDYLETIGHPRVTTFNEFGFEIAGKLSSVYKHPDDMDLWVGGFLEAAKGDSLVGPTFSEILADQFSRFRRGDRYFYENSPEINPGAFTNEQLQEIKSSTLARIICDNSDGIEAMSPRALMQPNVPGNAPVSCDNLHEIPQPNYRAWQENKPY